MPIVKFRQIIIVTFFCMILIWLLRLGTGEDDSGKVVRALPPLELTEVTQETTWTADSLRERLLVFVPEVKRKTAEELAAESAAKLARQQAAQAPPPIDKTIKPMFSQLDDDHQVGLLAVIQSDEMKYVVLQKINFASKQEQNFKLTESEAFDGWSVAIESQTQVVLNKSDRQIYLNLFKPGNI